MTKFNHRAKYLLPGSFFNEDESRELPERTVEAALAAAPEHAFAFQLYDVAVIDFEFDASLFRLVAIPQNQSATHYIGGEIFTADQLRLLATEEGRPDQYRTLIANLEGNGWPFVIRTRLGNWQPFEKDDVIVEPQHA